MKNLKIGWILKIAFICVLIIGVYKVFFVNEVRYQDGGRVLNQTEIELEIEVPNNFKEMQRKWFEEKDPEALGWLYHHKICEVKKDLYIEDIRELLGEPASGSLEDNQVAYEADYVAIHFVFLNGKLIGWKSL